MTATVKDQAPPRRLASGWRPDGKRIGRTRRSHCCVSGSCRRSEGPDRRVAAPPTLPSVDRTRIGIIGFSGGFWATAALQSGDSPFRAGVDFFGPVDFARLYETAPQQRPLIERFLGRPCENASAFQDASPVFHVDRTTVPMLVVPGDADRVIPIDQSLRFVQAMQTAGKPVEFLHLTGGHGFERQEQATAFETVATFLGRHLSAN